MKQTDLSRRDFTRLTAAAFGGVVAGTMAGCGQPNSTEPPADASPTAAGAPPPESGSSTTGDAAAETGSQSVSLLIDEPHVCRGLNGCKGLGKGKDNACAGQGTCASVEAHACAGQNSCKGQGGCGGKEGENDCKGMGGCHVPLEHGWEAVRARFEDAMKAAGKTFGAAPAA